MQLKRLDNSSKEAVDSLRKFIQDESNLKAPHLLVRRPIVKHPEEQESLEKRIEQLKDQLVEKVVIEESG